MHIHIHAQLQRVDACASHGTATDVERVDRRGCLDSRVDRHNTRSGA